MNLRIKLARLILRTGSLLQSSAMMVMKPDDLVEFTRQNYARSHEVDNWCDEEFVKTGLFPEEQEFLDRLPSHTGKLLLLGIGGGREAIPFARKGFQVTGVDYVPEMVACSIDNAREAGVEIHGVVQDIANLEVSEESFDVVWFSNSMYSGVPMRSRRVAMLERIYRCTLPGGHLVVQFGFREPVPYSHGTDSFRRFVACITRGYTQLETGDILKHQIEFSHNFADDQEVKAEIEQAGFILVYVSVYPGILKGAILAQKPA